MVGSNDIARSKKFYDALFVAMGGKPGFVAMGGKPGVEDAKGRLIYAHNGGRFMVSKPIDGKPANHANGGTIGFSVSEPKQADAWHKAGVANGGPRSRTRLACAKGPLASYISLIFAIPMATNCARFIACRLPELPQTKPEEGRPFRAVLARERTWLGPIGRALTN